MRSRNNSRDQMRDELRLLLDSDYWKYLPVYTKENILLMLDDYKLEYLHRPRN